ncbi:MULTISPECIES: efflux RND transporter periplasmic adaptor subunit [Meiothermus]|jgi:multidrug efflux pump subunit AcrA (membrane-fusion protein)|uniref:Efflux transporter, RND family, MFP subunit n=2 Tax=Meiothermus TaxID=65551 RepID=D3PKM9_MEIRD|nr:MULTISPECIES: HlyD family efflux transporter periplasmic adaptor subunit [Meiothermus]ADD28903.1 efflux transporter, RND family, MFP subunit [Meiothermus ruber DSM 1279]AGK05648.1 RND family efflux transporter MFP subunit [Meiothermus ruber DSM 1279]AWR86090.1 efflux transporter, RND family, MFP subunit [Meiothermus taiwanensis WR-220]MCL6530877.1 HlyD family efflux transporter periplasmic adaptor subunit [Meiothermus ruber]GAO75818.1 RND family efflux transporter MFP subunit [Meiothermus r
MKRWFWALVVALSLGLTLLGLLRPRAEQGLAVNVVRVEQGEFIREVRASGTVEARVYTLTFPRPGRVAEVRVREGQAVQAGQVLAVLETVNETAQRRVAAENLQALRARIQAQEAEFASNRTRLQNQLQEARRNLSLLQALLATGGVAANEVRQAERQVKDLEAQLTSLLQNRLSTQRELQAQLQARQNELAALERTIAQSTLRAPVAGVVSSVGFLVGVETTAPGGSGTSPSAPAIRLVEAGSLRVQARLSEAEIPFVRPGQPVRIELDAAPEQPLQGKVDRLGVQAEVAAGGGSAVLPVFIRFLDPQAEALARPGLTATANITTLRLPSALKIPLEALVEEQGQRFVWVVDTQSRTVRKQPIVLKARNLTQAAVEGLAEDSLLVSLPPETLKEGSKVSYRLPGAGGR